MLNRGDGYVDLEKELEKMDLKSCFMCLKAKRKGVFHEGEFICDECFEFIGGLNG